jgi:hypothetical protein
VHKIDGGELIADTVARGGFGQAIGVTGRDVSLLAFSAAPSAVVATAARAIGASGASERRRCHGSELEVLHGAP